MKRTFLFLFFLMFLFSCSGSEDTVSNTSCKDSDGDGFGIGQNCKGVVDCDDTNPDIFPGAKEICGNGIDEDCNGSDLACEQEEQKKCEDKDNDGFGVGDGCQGPIDCDDGNENINPDASEVCGNGIDEDCDGKDEECPPVCKDEDGDGFGVGDGCQGPVDCDDKNENINPDASEICGNGIDENCDGKDEECPPVCKDNDGDGYGEGDICKGPDCDDTNPDIHPGAGEICGNGVDENCDGKDEECPEVCDDKDGDGFGEGPDCKGPDCNDYNAAINPDAEEICGNGIDENCDGKDEECPKVCEDNDGDGFGVGADCEYVDCDDTNKNIYPGAEEICGNGIDEDCDGSDKECPETCVDEDGDGYGEGDACKGPDCDDTNPAINPEAEEICGNDVDENCDGEIEECPVDCVDNDGDGFGVGADCEYVDCDDTDPNINPDAEDLCGNGIDENCDGVDEECPQVECVDDTDCNTYEVCDLSENKCRSAKVWEWWAPVFYIDTDEDSGELNIPCTYDYDGDKILNNNEENIYSYDKPAYVYYSFVKTQTHWFIGYYLYFPKRWSSWGSLGTEYENAMRGVLLVIKQDPAPYGELVYMETFTEDSFLQYAHSVNNFSGGTEFIDGTINFDDSGHHPVIYVHTEDHGFYGDSYTWNNVSNWDKEGFPDGDGLIYSYGMKAETPQGIDGFVYYDFIPIKDSLWKDRNKISSTSVFDEFGHFASDEGYEKRSVAPWRFYDVNYPTYPAGEFIYNPVDLVRHHFKNGWGEFSYVYVYNPYAIRVDIDDLQILEDTDPIGAGDPDVFVTIYMYDGAGNEIKVLDIFNGYQKNWKKDEVPVSTILDMHKELGRYYFYGIEYPGKDYFGVDVKDYDGGITKSDWLMDPEETHYYTFTGQKLLDFGLSNSYFTVHNPADN